MSHTDRVKEWSLLLTKGLLLGGWSLLALTGALSTAADAASEGRTAVMNLLNRRGVKKLLHNAALLFSVTLAAIVLIGAGPAMELRFKERKVADPLKRYFWDTRLLGDKELANAAEYRRTQIGGKTGDRERRLGLTSVAALDLGGGL
jgi:hypothetical protein